MAFRVRVVTRAVLAALVAVIFAGAAVGLGVSDQGAAAYGPLAALVVAAIALAALAVSSYVLLKSGPRPAWPSFRVAFWATWAIPVAGLGVGLITSIVDSNIGHLGVAAWATGVVWLIELLLMRRYPGDLRLAPQQPS